MLPLFLRHCYSSDTHNAITTHETLFTFLKGSGWLENDEELPCSVFPFLGPIVLFAKEAAKSRGASAGVGVLCWCRSVVRIGGDLLYMCSFPPKNISISINNRHTTKGIMFSVFLLQNIYKFTILTYANRCGKNSIHLLVERA